jgi:autotransporter-associated beta strand protein
MHTVSSTRKSLVALGTLAAALALPASSIAQTTGFNQTAAGTYDYNTGGNWVGGTINGIWDSSLTVAGTQTVTFAAPTTASTGLTFNNAGNFALTLRGTGANQTLTLGGNISVATTGGTTANVTIGSGTANQNLNIDLGGATRTASVAASRTLTLTNVVSNGGITKNGAGTLTLSGTNTFAGGLNLDDGILMLGNNAALGTGTLTITGGSINVTGARTTTNNNVQNWNGDFTVVGGNTLNLGTGAVTINSDRMVTVSASTLTVGGAIGETGGSHSLTKSGAGTMILNGANSYTGGTIINGGVLQFGTGALPSTGAITINSAGVLNANNTLADVTAWLGKITSDSGGVIALTGSSSENLDFTAHNNLMLGATTASTYSGTLTADTTYRLGGGTAALTVTTALTGSGKSLVVGPAASTGSVILTNTNTYTGTTSLNSGSLILSGAAGSSAASAITANSGTILAFDSSTAGVTGATRAASVTLKGASLSVTGNGTANSVDTVAGALTVDAPSTFGSAGANTVTITAGAANAQLVAASLVRANHGAVFFRGTNLGLNTLASNTAGASNISFTSAPTAQLVGGGGASGTQTISILPWAVGADTAGGVPTGFVTYDAANGIRVLTSAEQATTIAEGTTTANNVKLSAATPVTANGATTINSLFINNAAANATVLAGTGALTVTSGAIYADLSLAGNNNVTTISKQIDFGTVQGVIGTLGTSNSKTLAFTGGITGSGGLMIYDTGTVSSTQAGVNLGATTYTGDTIINGSLIATSTNSLANFANGGRTGDVYVNGTLGLSINSGSVRINGLFGNGRITTPFSNATTLIVGDNNATSTFDGTISQGTGALSLTKVGTGTLTLTGSNNINTGATNIQNGTLSVVTLNNVAAPNSTSTLGRPITVTAGTIGLGSTTTTGTLKVVGTGETTDRVINLAGTTGGGAIEQAGTGLLKFTSNFTATGNGLKTLTLTGSTAGTGEIAGSIVNGSQATSLAKSGTGTWVLSGANTYTGNTTVTDGTLALGANNAFSSGSAIVLTAGTVDLRSFSTSAASLDFAAGSKLKFNLGTPGNGTALLALTGALAKTGSGVFNLDFSGSGAVGTYNLLSFASTAFTDQSEFTVVNLGSGLSGLLSLGANSLSLIVTTSSVPEPSTYALFAGAGVLLLAFGRRKRSA